MNATLQPSPTLPVHIQDHARTASSETLELPDLAEWEQRPGTQIVSEICAASSPYLAGTGKRPRNIRTLRRWRTAQPRRGPAYLKMGGRYYYTVNALREFYQRCMRGETL